MVSSPPSATLPIQLVAFEGFIRLGVGPVGAEVGGDVIVLVRDPL